MPTGFVSGTHVSKLRRIGINGLPDTGKTRALGLFDNPKWIISCPKEKGWGSLPPESKDVKISIYRTDTNDIKRSDDVISEFEALTFKAAKTVGLQTLEVDGLHKLYGYYLDAVTGGAYFQGREFKSTLYGPAHNLFANFIQTISDSDIPTVVFTTWAELEFRDEDTNLTKEERKDKRRFYYPNLPGMMARHVLGETATGWIYTTIQERCSHKGCYEQRMAQLEKGEIESLDHYVWQLRRYGEVAGAGFKFPAGTPDLPYFIHPSWEFLKKELEKRGK